jgi:tungstate transport system ATP-binding protein
MVILKVENIGKEFGSARVLGGINLEVKKGDAMVLIGPTGAGKTTLLRILNLLEKPTEGKLYIGGEETAVGKKGNLETRRLMAMVGQKPIVFNLSVYDNIACGLKWRGFKKDEIESKVNKAIKLIGMEEHTLRQAKTLSGGETQRLAIARALVTEPQILLLDEPTANLDPVSAAKIEEVLTVIIKSGETTVVMTTHDMSQGQRLARHIGVLINGRLLQVGSPTDIFARPASKEIAALVGVDNIADGVVTTKDEGTAIIEINGGKVQAVTGLDKGEKVYVMVRPEDITIFPQTEVSSAKNLLKGKIKWLVPSGPLLRVGLKTAAGLELFCLVTKSSATELRLKEGKEVYASFKATAVRVIKRY